MKPMQTVSLTVRRRIILLAVLVSAAFAVRPAQSLAQSAVSVDGWVVLPVNDYRALRDAAYPSPPQPTGPPVEATLSRVDYDLKVDGSLASGVARLTVDVIKDSWVKVAIPAGLMIRSAQVDGKQLSLVAEPSGKGPELRYLLLPHSGRSVVTLAVEMSVASVAGTDILKLPTGRAAVTRGSISLTSANSAAVGATEGLEVHVSGGLLLEKSESATESHWVAYATGNDGLTFAWKRRVEERKPVLPLKYRGQLVELVGFGEDSTQVKAEIQVDVQQGAASEVHIQLPDHLSINQVSGAEVADWESSPQQLTVTFLQPVTQTAAFTLSGEVKLPRDGQIETPIIRLAGAERESGGLAVEVLGAGEIKSHKSLGMDEAEAAEMGSLISSHQSPSLIAFRLLPLDGQAKRSLSLDVARYTPQAVLTANIEEAYYRALVTPDAKMLVVARLAIRNNQRNFLKVKLPSSAVLWSASVAGRPIRPGLAPDGSLLVSLEKTRGGQDSPAFPVEIAYLDTLPEWADKGKTRISLMTVDLPISKSGLLLHYSPLYRVTPVPGTLRGAPYQPPQSPALSGGYAAISQAVQTDANNQQASQAQPLASKIQSARVSTPIRNLPIRVAFPNFGPSIFFVSELTADNQTPVLEFDYQRDGKRGDR